MADITVATYDPKKVIITFGATVLSGYAEGTFVKITRSGDMFTKKKGAAGRVERVNTNATDFAVEVSLQQTAGVNAILSGLAAADQITNLGVLPLAVKDLNGTTLFAAPQAWIAKDPEAGFGDDTEARAWRFDTGPSAFLCGGN